MPKRKNETDNEWMERIRSYRDDRDELMQRTRAALCISNAVGSQQAKASMEMSAFMELFHPNYDNEKTRQLIRDAK